MMSCNDQHHQGIWQALRSQLLSSDGLFNSIELHSSSPARRSWWPVYRWALGWSNPCYRLKIDATSKSIPELYPSSHAVKV